MEDLRLSIYYVDGLESVGNTIGVSIRTPPGDKQIFEAWTADAELLIRSNDPPGRLVGVDRNSFVFASPTQAGDGWELHFVPIEP